MGGIIIIIGMISTTSCGLILNIYVDFNICLFKLGFVGFLDDLLRLNRNSPDLIQN